MVYKAKQLSKTMMKTIIMDNTDIKVPSIRECELKRRGSWAKLCFYNQSGCYYNISMDTAWGDFYMYIKNSHGLDNAKRISFDYLMENHMLIQYSKRA